MKKRLIAVVCICLFFTATQARAVTLFLEPSLSTVAEGDSVSLDLVIAGLGNYTSDSLGDFDIDITYDIGALSFDGYNLGGHLGDVGLSEAIDFSFGEYAPGTIRLAELSLLTVQELDAIQAGSFTLVTLDFTVDSLVEGATTFVSIDTVWALGDSYGDPLALDGTRDAAIQAATVPEPTTLLLMGLGLVALGLARGKFIVRKLSL